MASLEGHAHCMQMVLLIADEDSVVIRAHLPEPLIGNSTW